MPEVEHWHRWVRVQIIVLSREWKEECAQRMKSYFCLHLKKKTCGFWSPLCMKSDLLMFARWWWNHWNVPALLSEKGKRWEGYWGRKTVHRFEISLSYTASSSPGSRPAGLQDSDLCQSEPYSETLYQREGRWERKDRQMAHHPCSGHVVMTYRLSVRLTS